MQLAMRNRGSKLLKKYPRLDLRARAKRGFIHGVKRVNRGGGETAGFRCDGLGKLCCDRKVDMRRDEAGELIGWPAKFPITNDRRIAERFRFLELHWIAVAGPGEGTVDAPPR